MQEEQKVDRANDEKFKSCQWGEILEIVPQENIRQQIQSELEENYPNGATSIQANSICMYFEKNFQKGKQLLVLQAPGGSGKTLAFGIPAVIKAIQLYEQNNSQQYVSKDVFKKGPKKGESFLKYSPSIVILAHTKLLVHQIVEDLKSIIPTHYKDKIDITEISQGIDETKQKCGSILVTNANLLKQRINSNFDHTREKEINLPSCQLFIMDEAEEVLKQSESQVKSLFKVLTNIQDIITILCSATITDGLKTVAIEDYLKSNDYITAKLKVDLEGVTQYSVKLSNPDDGIQSTLNILNEIYIQKKMETQTIIFLEQKENITLLAESIQAVGSFQDQFFQIIHGSLDNDTTKQYNLMTERYKNFREGNYKVLLCTNIMARGIDIDKVGLVINVFAPRDNSKEKTSPINPRHYLHRIARTGRYIRKGVALTFLRPDSDPFFSTNDAALESNVLGVEGLEKNKIHSISPNQYDIVSESITEALQFNETNKDQKE